MDRASLLLLAVLSEVVLVGVFVLVDAPTRIAVVLGTILAIWMVLFVALEEAPTPPG